MNELAGLSVLLVEDEYLIALDASEILKTLGAKEVEIVASFERAQRRAAEGQFDLAVLDVNINGRFSFPIAGTIGERGIPFVFATGYELSHRSEAGLDGAVCVTKPYTRDRLKDALAAALAKAAPKQ
jgi:CheY-like chemotaxis protein